MAKHHPRYRNASIDISARLCALRRQYNYTQQQIADFVYVKIKTYQAYENKISEPSIHTLLRLAELYCFATVNELLGLENEEPAGGLLKKYRRAPMDKRRIVDFVLKAG